MDGKERRLFFGEKLLPEVPKRFVDEMKRRENRREQGMIQKVIFSDPVTVVLWADGTKTKVKCQPGDTFSKEMGLAMCVAKKFFGNKSSYNDIFKKYIEGYGQ